jgi:hypothetical protein
MVDNDDYDTFGGMIGNSEETCPSATLSTSDPKLPTRSSKQDRRGGKPATNHLS